MTRMTIERETVTVPWVNKEAEPRVNEIGHLWLASDERGRVFPSVLVGHRIPKDAVKVMLIPLPNAAPTPLLDGQGSLQAASQPSVPTEGHGAAVLDKDQWRAIEHAAMDAGAYSWRRARLAMVEDGQVIGYPVFSRADMAELARLYRDGASQQAAVSTASQPGTERSGVDQSNPPPSADSGVREILRKLVAAWDKVEPDVNAVFLTQHARTGIGYTGPEDFADALTEARQALSPAQDEVSNG